MIRLLLRLCDIVITKTSKSTQLDDKICNEADNFIFRFKFLSNSHLFAIFHILTELNVQKLNNVVVYLNNKT